MFELWILFELLDYLSLELGADITISPSLELFHIKLGDIHFDLRYQPSYQGWALKGTPDYSIEVDDKIRVIMDAKNWIDQKDEAIYKMLGYLNNLDASVGILIFPNDVSIEKPLISTVGRQNHPNQHIFNCVIPLTGQERTEKRKDSLMKVVNLIIDNITH